MKLLRVALPGILLALFAVLPLQGALAAGPEPAKVQLSSSAQTSVGAHTTVTALVTDAAGNAVAGARVVFTESLTFLNTTDAVVLGQATTNAQGAAKFDYVPRSEGNLTLTGTVSGTTKAVKGTLPIAVSAGTVQFQDDPTGISIPGVSMWLLAIVLGGIWFVFLWAMVQVRGIAREKAK